MVEISTSSRCAISFADHNVGDHARDLELAYREFQDRRLTVRLRRGRTARSAGDSTRLSAAAIYMTDSQPN
ncbi:hypothetical protein [Bradyrhizobium sp. AZCC 2289]|uniref:hypothetical protein n=1 Tax=Bradyrhizobium sp. AZCC 2289 TaxID=3117026 RepID=UPI002FF0F924